MKRKIFTYAVTSPLTTGVVVTTGPAKLWRVYVNAALSAHAVTINDGTTMQVTLPASAAAGSNYEFGGIPFDTAMRVGVNTAGAGSITILYTE